MAVSPHPKLTYEDYVAFPDDGLRRELIDGEVSLAPAPNLRHQRLVLRMARVLADHLDRHGGGEIFVAPCDVVLSDIDVVGPDVIFVAEADAWILTEANIRGAPTLVMEVVSDPATDRRRKRELYGRHRIPEYWIVDPDADRVEMHRLEEAGYGKPDIVEPGEILTTTLLPGLALDLTDIFRR